MLKLLQISISSMFIAYNISSVEAVRIYNTESGNEISKKLSDHNSLLVNHSESKIKFICWNLWARGTRGGFDGHEKGYGNRKEPNVEKRISDNIKKVIDNLNENPYSFFALQEINTTKDMNKLKNQLNNTQFKMIYSETKGESFSHALIYNSDYFELKKNINIKSIDNLINHNGVDQKNRYISGVFENSNGEEINVTSVHLKWKSTKSDITNAISNIPFENFVVMGDFNQDLTTYDNKEFKVFSNKDGSIVSGRNTASKKTNDAIVIKIKIFSKGEKINNLIDLNEKYTNRIKKSKYSIESNVLGSLQDSVKLLKEKNIISNDDFSDIASTNFKLQEQTLNKILKEKKYSSKKYGDYKISDKNGFETFINHKITGRLQKKVSEAYKNNKLSVSDLTILGSKPFKDQKY